MSVCCLHSQYGMHIHTLKYTVIGCVLCRKQTQHCHSEGEMTDAPLTVLSVCEQTASTQNKKGTTKTGKAMTEVVCTGQHGKWTTEQSPRREHEAHLEYQWPWHVLHPSSWGPAIHQSYHPTETGLQLCFEIQLWWKVHLTLCTYIPCTNEGPVQWTVDA